MQQAVAVAGCKPSFVLSVLARLSNSIYCPSGCLPIFATCSATRPFSGTNPCGTGTSAGRRLHKHTTSEGSGRVQGCSSFVHTPSVRGFLHGCHPHATLFHSLCMRWGRRPSAGHVGDTQTQTPVRRSMAARLWERRGLEGKRKAHLPSPLCPAVATEQLPRQAAARGGPAEQQQPHHHSRRLPKTIPAQLRSSVQASPVTSGAVRGLPGPLW